MVQIVPLEAPRCATVPRFDALACNIDPVTAYTPLEEGGVNLVAMVKMQVYSLRLNQRERH